MYSNVLFLYVIRGCFTAVRTRVRTYDTLSIVLSGRGQTAAVGTIDCHACATPIQPGKSVAAAANSEVSQFLPFPIIHLSSDLLALKTQVSSYLLFESLFSFSLLEERSWFSRQGTNLRFPFKQTLVRDTYRKALRSCYS